MELTLPLGADVWDLDQLRLPAEMVENLEIRRRPARRESRDPFIAGPISYAWIASASRLPGAGVRVAIAFRFLCCRFRRENRWGLDKIVKGLRISDRSTQRGLYAAELAGLLSGSREPGCKLAVSVLDLPTLNARPDRRPLNGPIPWARWLPASRLPGRSLQVASVCWRLAGWERPAEFELALESWPEFGLSRFSVSRGLDGLERAGLVSVGRTPGRSPVVTILEANVANN